MDWRALHDPLADSRLLRMSVGVENVGDLKRDLERGLERVAAWVGGGGGGGGGVDGVGAGNEGDEEGKTARVRSKL